MSIDYNALNKLKNLNALKNKVDGVHADRRLSKLKIDTVVSVKQVRTNFADLESLAQSLREIGQQSPILVKPQNEEGKHVILQGERRWRAAKLAGLTEIDAIILDKEVSECDRILGQLTENLQRDDMKPLEIAFAFEELRALGFKQKDIAQRLGLAKGYVSLYLSLTKIPPQLEPLSSEGIVRDGQALAFLSQAYSLNPEFTLALIDLSRQQNENQVTRVAARRILDRVRKDDEEKSASESPAGAVPESGLEAEAAVQSSADEAETLGIENTEGERNNDPASQASTSSPEDDIERSSAKSSGEQRRKSEAEPASGSGPVVSPRQPRAYEARIPQHKLGEGCIPLAQGERLHVFVTVFSKVENEDTLEHGYLTPNVRASSPDHVCVTINGEVRSVPNDFVNIVRVIPASEIPDAEL